jgi:hypothetical protein
MSTIARTMRAVVLGVVLVTVPAVAVAAPASASTTCPVVYWGSLPKTSTLMTIDPLTNVRTGQHACYDRIVFDISGSGAVGYDVRYVDQVVHDGSGEPIPLAGGAAIQIVVRAPSYNSSGSPTYRPADPTHLTNVSGYRTFRQVASAGSFEGQSNFGLGVRARLPMRVFVLSGPDGAERLVVDVAHKWGSF